MWGKYRKLYTVLSYLVLFTFFICCSLRCLVCIVVSCLVGIVVSCVVYIDVCCLVCDVVVVLCVLLSYVYLLYSVCIVVFTLDTGLLARSHNSECPATGHLDTGFSLFPCA